jgi:hypothetical protein
MSRDTFADVAAILHPLPEAPDPDDTDTPDGYDAARQQAGQDRQQTIDQLRLGWDEGGIDPLLSALTTARRARERAETQIRHLVAYGREFTIPRPYTLGDLADAAGMSVSGVRTGYDHHDVDAVAETTGARPREWRVTDPTDDAAIRGLLDDLARRHQGDPARPSQVYYTLKARGWTPHAPDARTPGTKAAKRYIRWERTWPGGSTVTLYQEADHVIASGKIADAGPVRFRVDYTQTDPHQLDEQLATLTGHVDELEASRGQGAARIAPSRREPDPERGSSQ